MRSPRLLKGRTRTIRVALKNFAHLNIACRLNQRKARFAGIKGFVLNYSILPANKEKQLKSFDLLC